MPMQPLPTRPSGARSSIESVVPSSPCLPMSSCQGAVDDAATPLPLTRPCPEVTPDALAKPRQCPRVPVLPLPKEKAVEQSPLQPVTEADSVRHAASEQVRGLGVLPQLDLVDGQMPVKNTFINFDVPDSSPCASPRANTLPLSGDSEPKNWAPAQFVIKDSDRHDVELPQLDAFDGQLAVKNTFISFVSPRAKTQPLSGDSEPKDWAPGPFGLQDSDWHDDSKCVAASQDPAMQDAPGMPAVKGTTTHPACMGDSPCPALMGVSPEPYFMGASPDGLPSWNEQTAVENPVVINLQQSLDQAVSAPKQDTNRIQLNLSLWIASKPPAASATASTACEPPPRVRLGVHHFPVSHTLPSASPRAPTALVVPAARVGTGPGISGDVCSRRLFHI